MEFHDIKINEKDGTVFIDEKEIQGIAENGITVLISKEKNEINIKIIAFKSLEIISD